MRERLYERRRRRRICQTVEWLNSSDPALVPWRILPSSPTHPRPRAIMPSCLHCCEAVVLQPGEELAALLSSLIVIQPAVLRAVKGGRPLRAAAICLVNGARLSSARKIKRVLRRSFDFPITLPLFESCRIWVIVGCG